MSARPFPLRLHLQLQLQLHLHLPLHVAAALVLCAASALAGTNLTPASGLASGANIGWIDARAGDGAHGAVLGACVCKGFLYSANCGWINLGDGTPANGAQYTNTSGADAGVNRLPDGRLRGLAWGASIGWISFENTGQPRLDPVTGELTGKAWSASCGWICFDTPPGGIYAVVSDTDHDGLPDEWEYSYAATLTTLTANGDHDGDGQSDTAEYAADTDPAEAASRLQVTAFAPGPNTASLTWTSSPARNYRVQVSSDLTNWTWDNFAVIPPASTLVAAGAAGATTTTRSVLKPAGPRQFFRVIALKPPAAP